MRQTSCKRLSLLFIHLFILVFFASAQDTSKASSATKPKTSIKPAAATSTVQKTKKTVPASTKATTQVPATSPAATSVKAKAGVDSAKTVIKQPVIQSGPKDNSLKGQYEDLLKYSWMQKGYKVINPGRLSSLWKSVNDSLATNKKQLADVKKRLEEQTKQINELKASPTTSAAATEKPVASSNQIEVLGMYVDTSTYNWIVWGTILVLGLALAVVLLTTTKRSLDAKQHKQLYNEISEEYQTYKAKSKEKELKLARELQTERNTIEELRAKRDEEEPVRKGRGKG
jgi:Sec-independent protein translocase protein TatA